VLAGEALVGLFSEFEIEHGVLTWLQLKAMREEHKIYAKNARED
jgi:hypothetical protein